jgi:hypothetical protein
MTTAKSGKSKPRMDVAPVAGHGDNSRTLHAIIETAGSGNIKVPGPAFDLASSATNTSCALRQTLASASFIEHPGE